MSWFKSTQRTHADVEQEPVSEPVATKPVYPTDAEIAAAIGEVNATYVETVPDFGTTTECRACGEQFAITRTYETRKMPLDSLPTIQSTVNSPYGSGHRESHRYVTHEYLTVQCSSCGLVLPNEKPKNYELPDAWERSRSWESDW